MEVSGFGLSQKSLEKISTTIEICKFGEEY
jgi:hypothetical protein